MAEIWRIVRTLCALIVKVILHHSRVCINKLGLGIEHRGEKHRPRHVNTLCLLHELFVAEGAHLLHLEQIVIDLRITAHRVGGKTVLRPTETVEVWQCALKHPLHAPPRSATLHGGVGETSEIHATLIVEPVEDARSLRHILSRLPVVGLRLGSNPIVNLPQIDGKCFTTFTIFQKTAGVILLLCRILQIRTLHNLNTGQREKQGNLHILHQERMIPVLSAYLFQHDTGNELQLLRTALIPRTRQLQVNAPRIIYTKRCHIATR